MEKGSAVHWREEFGSRTDTTYLLFVFLRTAVRRLDTGCLLLAHWPRGVRTKAGLFFLVGTSGLHLKDISRLYDSMFVCEYLDMYDKRTYGRYFVTYVNHESVYIRNLITILFKTSYPQKN